MRVVLVSWDGEAYTVVLLTEQGTEAGHQEFPALLAEASLYMTEWVKNGKVVL